MSINAITDIANLQIEGVQDVVPELVEATGTLDAAIQDNGRAQQVSTKSYRVPFNYAFPGNVSAGDLDGGALPLGDGGKWDQGTVTPKVIMLAIGWTKLTEMVGKKVDKLAVENVVDKTMVTAAKQLRTFRDIFLQTDGTGNIGTVSGAPDTVNKIITVKGGFGARNIKTGQTVGIWNGTSLRGTVKVGVVSNMVGGTQQFVYSGYTAVNGAEATMANNDIIRVAGLTDGAPAFIQGLRSFINTSTTGSLMGITKANAPYVVSNGLDCGGAQITLPVLRLVLTQIENRLGPEGLSAMQFWHTHASQKASYEELGFERQEIESSGNFDGMDLLFKGKMSAASYAINTNPHADNTIWDFVAPKSFGKVKYGDGSFWYEVNGSKIYPIYDTTGAPKTQFGSTLVDPVQYFCDNVLNQASLSNLGKPVGN